MFAALFLSRGALCLKKGHVERGNPPDTSRAMRPTSTGVGSSVRQSSCRATICSNGTRPHSSEEKASWSSASARHSAIYRNTKAALFS